MNKNAFRDALSNSHFAKYSDYLFESRRLALSLSRAESVNFCSSRFGGKPALEFGSEWPTYEGENYRFLCQVNLSEISCDSSLPSSGLLSFFYKHDEDGETFEGDSDFVKCFFFQDLKQLIEVVSPSNVDFGESYPIRIEACTDIPYDEYRYINSPFPDDFDYLELSEFRNEKLVTSANYLLGYPTHRTLAYDPTPTGCIPLLTIDSDDDLEWYWHDGDKLMMFIDEQRLLKEDFSKIHTCAG